MNTLSNCYIAILIEGISFTHTCPVKGKTVTATQLEPILGGAQVQGWWLMDWQRTVAVSLKPVTENASYPRSFVEEKWLPVTSQEHD